MKPVYSNITIATGARLAGIFQIQIAPREWLTVNPIIDFSTGKVLTPLSFIAGKSLLTLTFTPDSYNYEEKPKSSKGGDFYEVNVTGTINTVNEDLHQVLETMKRHELVTLVKDRKKRTRLVGSMDAGMQMKINYRQNNTNGGNEIATIDLLQDVEDSPPFYEV